MNKKVGNMNKLITQFFSKAKDGGPESPVNGYFIIEVKSLGSIAFLKFNQGCREAFHTHAFNALTWFIKGDLIEENFDGSLYTYKKSIMPKITPKSKNHRVLANKDSWCLTIRGPWDKTWTETNNSKITVLTSGRHIIN